MYLGRRIRVLVLDLRLHYLVDGLWELFCLLVVGSDLILLFSTVGLCLRTQFPTSTADGRSL